MRSYGQHVDTGAAHATLLSDMLVRLQQEHTELMQVLLEIEAKAGELRQERDRGNCLQSLLNLRLWSMAFIGELERHSAWEAKDLFPFLQEYFHQDPGPSMMSSLWMLEKEHELAEEYMQTFLRAVHALNTDSEITVMKQAVAYLIQACLILKEHLHKEEKLVFPMTEKILTDLRLLFS